MPHISGETKFNGSSAMLSGRTFQTSSLLSKEQRDTDYFIWISGKFFQSPED